MLYLAQFEYVEPGPLYPPEKVVDMVANAITASLDQVAELERAGKIRAAGVLAGSKGSAMIVDADDHGDLSRVLQSLPFWSIMRVAVTPLQSFSERASQEKQAVEFLRSPEGEQFRNAW